MENIEKEIEKILTVKNFDYNKYYSKRAELDFVSIDFIPKSIKEVSVKYGIPYGFIKSSISFNQKNPDIINFKLVYAGKPYIEVYVPEDVNVFRVHFDEEFCKLTIDGSTKNIESLRELILQIPMIHDKKFEEKLMKAGL